MNLIKISWEKLAAVQKLNMHIWKEIALYEYMYIRSWERNANGFVEYKINVFFIEKDLIINQK